MFIYFLLNVGFFKKLGIKSRIFFSVRVQGKKFISIQNKSVVQRHGWLLALKIDENDPILEIGEGSALGDFIHIVAVREIIIEENVTIANKVYISDNLHSYEDINTPIINQPIKFIEKVRIGSGSWIGENVCIIGASIGKHVVVGANSVVTQDIPDFTVVSGNPARVIRKYNFEKNIWE